MNIEKVYGEIFKSYGIENLSHRIQKIIEMDEFLPYNATFFCVTNTQNLSFEYVSKNIYALLGYKSQLIQNKGMRFFWSKIHPEDIELWLKALNELMQFTMSEIAIEDRHQMTYVWNYRIMNANGTYVNVIQNTTPLEFDSEEKPIIGLAHYTILNENLSLDITASAKLMNPENEYETVYFSNFSQKLLTNGLTNRERDVIRLLVLNYSSKSIAEKLFISSNTVDTHRRNILKKLGISSTGELVGLLKLHKLLI